MKKVFQSVLSIALIFSFFISASAEIISQPMHGREEIAEKPVSEHPRLMFRESEIAGIKESLTHSQNTAAYNEYRSFLSLDKSGSLPESDEYNYDEEAVAVFEAKAFSYIIEGNEENGIAAYKGITDFMNTLNYDPASGKGQNYHDASHVLFIAAEIYDWCYHLMDDAAKTGFIEAGQKLMGKLDWGYPVNMESRSMVSGGGSSTMLLLDLFSFSIATYDENPDLYNYLSAVIKQKNMPGRNYWYRSGKYMSGTSYGAIRAYSDSWLYWMADNALGVQLHEDYFTGLASYILYEYLPDGKYFREGDHNWHAFTQTNNDYQSNSTERFAVLSILSSIEKNSYYKEMAEIIKPYFIKTSSSKSTAFGYGYVPFTAVQYLFVNDTSVEGAGLSELPNTSYFGEPDGTMIAKTGWTTGRTAPDAQAFMKIGGQQLYDHNHNDMGSFQLYYKGLLMQDMGIYQRTDNAQYYAYNTSTVSHNSLLIYDPLEYYHPRSVLLKDSSTNEYYDVNVGGQKYIVPVKSHYDFSQYNEDLYDRADVTAYGWGPDYNEPSYSYISGDITKAYSDKAENADRSMLFMPTGIEGAPAVFAVMDKVTSANKYMDKRFLFHCIEEPVISGNAITVKRGTLEGDSYTGELTSQILSPKSYKIDVYGGPGSQWMVNGVNFYPNNYTNGNTRLDFGWGRLEISSAEENETEYFLNVMYMNDGGKYESVQTAELIETEEIIGGRVLNTVALFNKSEEKINSSASFEISGTDTVSVALTGMDSGSWNVYENGALISTVGVSEESGVLYFTGSGGEYEVKKAQLPTPDAEISYTSDGYVLSIDKTPYPEGTAFKINISGSEFIIAEDTYTLAGLSENTGYTLEVTALSDGASPASEAAFLQFNTSFGGGDGTKENPYRISTKEHFFNIKSDKNAYYILTNDIVIPDSYIPFDFTGSFNGNGKSIRLNLELPTADYVGLFSKVSEDAEIFDLSIHGRVAGYSYVGGIAGSSEASIRDCVNYADVTAGLSYAGGIAGYTKSNTNTVRGCVNFGEVKTSSVSSERYKYAGGITGSNLSPVILCENYGQVSSGTGAGGISGYAAGDIYAGSNRGEVYAAFTSGGIAGIISSNHIFKECYNTGRVTGNISAGIVGANESKGSKILRCYNIGEISSDTAIYGGGEALYQFSDCYAAGASADGAAVLSDEEFRTEDSFGFDFEDIWSFKDNGYPYPQLKYADEVNSEPAPDWTEEPVPEAELIKTASDFINMNPAGTYRLAADIDLTEGYIPFEFSGSLYGNGYTVKLKHNYPEESYIGLFSSLTAEALVSDVAIEGTVIGKSYVGGIAGSSGGMIINCKNYASVSTPSSASSGGTHGGGITGHLHSGGGISGCINYGEIKGRGSYFGGIVGVNINSTVISCVNYGNVSTYQGGGAYAGISGNSSGGNIEKCANFGSVSASGAAGGIVGQNSGGAARITDCSNAGSIYSVGTNAGGIAGQTPLNGGVLSYCCNAGTVKCGSADYSVQKAIFGGTVSDSITISVNDCYYLNSDEAQQGSFGSALTEEEMKLEESFAGFDFNGIWVMKSSGYYYPQLQSAAADRDYCYNPLGVETPRLYEQYYNEITLFSFSQISSSEIFTLRNKCVILSYADVYSGSEEYALKECGMALSEYDSAPVVGAEGCASAASEALSDTYGILFHGGISEDTDYYIRPYAVYEYKGSIYTLYGDTAVVRAVQTTL